MNLRRDFASNTIVSAPEGRARCTSEGAIIANRDNLPVTSLDCENTFFSRETLQNDRNQRPVSQCGVFCVQIVRFVVRNGAALQN